MPPALARAALLLLAGATALGGAWVSWTQSNTYPVTHPALYACSLAPLAVALVALVTLFVPFDRPASAPRWTAPLVGLALGLAGGGLVMYTATFVWVAPALLAYAALLRACARAIAATAEDPPPRGAGRGVALLAAVAGVGLGWAWQAPPGEARPAPLGLDVASVTTDVGAPVRRMVRVARRRDAVTLSGNRVEATLSLERPRVEVHLRGQRFVIEPTLQVEEGTVDGFFSVPALNGFHAEAGGPGEVEVAEGVDPERKGVGWARATYPTTRVSHPGALAPRLGGWGRPSDDALSARLDVVIDLDHGRVTVDAVTTVPRSLTVRRSTLGRLRVARAGAARLGFGLGAGFDVVPPEGRPGRSTAPAEMLVTDDGEVVRAVRARRRDEGPFETVEVGHYGGWFAIDGLRDRFLVVAPDWEPQASLAPSRTAGHGLPENALVHWREEGDLHVVMDVAGTRVGPGRLSSQLPAGLYRSRLVLLALGHDERAGPRGRAEHVRVTGGPRVRAARPAR
ncbi:MAG: hypothetical protein M9894_13170 [Planctomycetes bacterium]|nr:hypothetical protein [Planctomycetota bacterium]